MTSDAAVFSIGKSTGQPVVPAASDSMNIFELNLIASPIGGIVGGLVATNGASAAIRVAGGVSGFVVGVAIFIASLALTWFSLRFEAMRKSNLGAVGRAVELAVMLPQALLWLISFAAARAVAGFLVS